MIAALLAASTASCGGTSVSKFSRRRKSLPDMESARAPMRSTPIPDIPASRDGLMLYRSNRDDFETRLGSSPPHACLRKAHRYGRSLAKDAFDFKRAAMQFDETLRKRQPQPRAAVGPIERAVDLAEGLECNRNLFGRHADARIGDRDGEVPILVDECRHRHASSFGRELDGIREQVDQDLAQSCAARDKRWKCYGRHVVQGNTVLVNLRPKGRNAPFYENGYLHDFVVDLH